MALDSGISEQEFWFMTFAEVDRAIESQKRKEQKQAIYNYKLADLIGYSCARVHNKSNKMPTIYEAYPNLFEIDEEEEQAKKNELSVLRFKHFAQSYNTKFKGVLSTNE